MTTQNLIPKIPLSSENIKIFQYLVIGVILYFIVRKYMRDLAYSKAGSDANTAFAIQIRQACNPSGIDLLVEFDGTQVQPLMLIADQIANVDRVANAYSNLYNENMYKRLEKELDSADFQEWVRRAQAVPTSTAVPGSGGTPTLYATKDTVVLLDTDTTKVAKTVKAGQTIGKRLNAYSITNKAGQKNLYYLVSWTELIFLESRGLVLAADTREV